MYCITVKIQIKLIIYCLVNVKVHCEWYYGVDIIIVPNLAMVKYVLGRY